MTGRKLRLALAGYAVVSAVAIAALVPVLAADVQTILTPAPALEAPEDIEQFVTRTPAQPKVVPADPDVDAAFEQADR